MKKNQLKNLGEVCSSIYSSPFKSSIRLPSIDIGFEKYLERNRLAHFFAKNYRGDKRDSREFLRKIAEWKIELIDWEDKIESNLRDIYKLVKADEVLVIKTFSSYPHVTGDLDIVVTEKINIEDIRYKLSVSHSVLMTDIAHDVSWTNTPEISSQFIWKNTEKKIFRGLNIQVPNPKLDVLIRMGHMPFEMGEVRLGELLHIFERGRKVDWKAIEQEAMTCGWGKTFREMKQVIAQLHRNLFNEEYFEENVSQDMTPAYFPYKLPYMMLARAILEKRAWGKLWGARYIVAERFGLTL